MQKITVECNGYQIDAEFFKPDKERFPVVVMCHAMGGQMSNFHITANTFAENGIGAFLFNFRGGSNFDNSGFPTEQMTLFTEKDDLYAVLDYLKTQTYVEKIFLFGASQGGMVAAMVAEERLDEIDGLILLYPGFCIADHLRREFQTVPETFELFHMKIGQDYVLSMRNYDTFKEVGKFSKPILIVHGDADTLVPLEYSIRAAKHYPNASLTVLANEKHGFTAKGNAKAAELSLAFLKQHV